MASIGTTQITPSNGANSAKYRGAFAIMTSLFFLWGFMTVFNDILIPRFKEAFTLSYFQAMLVQLGFFGSGCSVGSLRSISIALLCRCSSGVRAVALLSSVLVSRGGSPSFSRGSVSAAGSVSLSRAQGSTTTTTTK